jgi:hypothetical protein
MTQLEFEQIIEHALASYRRGRPALVEDEDGKLLYGERCPKRSETTAQMWNGSRSKWTAIYLWRTPASRMLSTTHGKTGGTGDQRREEVQNQDDKIESTSTRTTTSPAMGPQRSNSFKGCGIRFPKAPLLGSL